MVAVSTVSMGGGETQNSPLKNEQREMPEVPWSSTSSGKNAVPKTPAGIFCLDKDFELIEGHPPGGWVEMRTGTRIICGLVGSRTNPPFAMYAKDGASILEMRQA